MEGRHIRLDLKEKIPRAQENIHIFGTLFLGRVWYQNKEFYKKKRTLLVAGES